MRKLKIVLTGGHAGSTAYAVIQKLKKSRKFVWEIVWVGAESAVEGAKIATYESQVFPEIGIQTISLITGRLQTRFSLWTIPALFKIPLGFVHALLVMLSEKPDIVVSFGGFVAFPVCFWAWALRLPVIIHEQTSVVGRANQLSKYFATKIAISRSESLGFFPKGKTVMVGNPVSEEILTVGPKVKMGNPPTILITGGSRGSVAINEAVDNILESLLQKYRIIHQTGTLQFDKFIFRKTKLSKKLVQRYEVFELVPPWQWYKKIAEADLIVGRAGANNVSEVLVAKRPAIFIPLPISYKNEQMKNAQYAQGFVSCKIILQKDLDSEKLLRKIQHMLSSWKKPRPNSAKINPDLQASANLLGLIERLVK